MFVHLCSRFCNISCVMCQCLSKQLRWRIFSKYRRLLDSSRSRMALEIINPPADVPLCTVPGRLMHVASRYDMLVPRAFSVPHTPTPTPPARREKEPAWGLCRLLVVPPSRERDERGKTGEGARKRSDCGHLTRVWITAPSHQVVIVDRAKLKTN